MQTWLLLSLAVLAFTANVSLAQEGKTFDTTYYGVTFTQQIWHFTQKLDHFHPNTIDVWQQKYVTYNEYFDPVNGAVFISIGGESSMEGISKGRSWLLQLAKQFKALVVSVEHRFYGESQPFGKTDTSYSIDNLKYLTVDQALEDLAAIVHAIKHDNVLVGRFHASERNPFITIGGSYPGAMSAWFRYKFPHLTAGALASSAVVNAIVDFTQYDGQVFLSTRETNPYCPNYIQKFNAQLETNLNLSGASYQATLVLYGAIALSQVEFLYYIADQQAGLVQYGNVATLCQIFQEDNFTNNQNRFVTYLQSQSTTIQGGYTLADLKNTKYSQSSNWRQWQYQVCTYFGWLQTPSKVDPMRSASITLSYFLNQCQLAFGPQYLPSEQRTNGYLGGLKIQATNLVFTNGSQDPWKWASLLSPTDSTVSIVTKCAGCAHGCELGYSQPSDATAITATKIQVVGLFQIWINEHLAKYSFTPVTSPIPKQL